jgi:hypothetical protein
MVKTNRSRLYKYHSGQNDGRYSRAPRSIFLAYADDFGRKYGANDKIDRKALEKQNH